MKKLTIIDLLIIAMVLFLAFVEVMILRAVVMWLQGPHEF